MKTLVNALVVLAGLLLAAIWLGWMVDPARMAAEWGLSSLSLPGTNNLRGDIGGLFLSVAVFCGLYFVGGAVWLRAAGIVMVCVMVGRYAGIGFDGYHPQSMFNAIVEALFLLVFMAAIRFGGRP